jgi:hypothetical protein
MREENQPFVKILSKKKPVPVISESQHISIQRAEQKKKCQDKRNSLSTCAIVGIANI